MAFVRFLTFRQKWSSACEFDFKDNTKDSLVTKALDWLSRLFKVQQSKTLLEGLSFAPLLKDKHVKKKISRTNREL